MYEANKRRKIVFCRPDRLPVENDLKTIRKYILLKMEELTKKFSYISSSDYVQLCDAALSRLIILNNRRDGYYDISHYDCLLMIGKQPKKTYGLTSRT